MGRSLVRWKVTSGASARREGVSTGRRVLSLDWMGGQGGLGGRHRWDSCWRSGIVTGRFGRGREGYRRGLGCPVSTL